MNLSEFKAWFDGFTENIDGEPSAKQWERIKERVSEITPDSTPYPVFIERYYRPYQPWWGGAAYTTCGGTLSNLTHERQALTNMANGPARFLKAGRAESASLS